MADGREACFKGTQETWGKHAAALLCTVTHLKSQPWGRCPMQSG